MEKFKKAYNKWIKADKELGETSTEYLNKVLDDAPNNEITLSEDNMVSVTYDGGNHPEYASDCYNMVNGVYKKNGDIYLNTEDCDEYELENVSPIEIYWVADAVSNELAK